MLNQKLSSLIVIGLVLIIAVASGGYYYGLRIGEKVGQEAGQKEVAELKSRFQTFFPPLPVEIFSISGPIKEIGKDFIVVEYVLPSELPLLPGETPKTEQRKAVINQDTEIVKIDFSLPLVPPKPGELPAGPKETKISLSDLKVGDQVTVTAKENIKDKKEFTASRIQIQIYPTP